MEPVDKEFCDERSGHILTDTQSLKEDMRAIRRSVDRMTWLLVTTLAGLCISLALKDSKVLDICYALSY